MGNARHAEKGLWLSSWILGLVACGGGATDGAMDTAQQAGTPIRDIQQQMPKSSAGGGAVAGPIMRASARIEPLMFPPPASAMMTAGATTAAGTAGMPAASAAAGAMASAAAAGGGAAGMGASSTGAAGSKGMGAGYAAGSGGTPSTSASAGMSGMAVGAAGMGATSAAPGMAKAAAGAAAPATISGTATFVTGSRGVTLNVMVSGCVNDKSYAIHIHTGSSCESVMSQQGHWDMTRGEGIPNIVCGAKQGATMTVREPMDPTTAWTVGDGSATDVVGHVMVIHDADDPTWRIACGPIVKN